jgi:hypothetical protein
MKYECCLKAFSFGFLFSFSSPKESDSRNGGWRTHFRRAAIIALIVVMRQCTIHACVSVGVNLSSFIYIYIYIGHPFYSFRPKDVYYGVTPLILGLNTFLVLEF